MAVGWGMLSSQKPYGCCTPDPIDVGWRWVQNGNGCGVRVCRTPNAMAVGWKWVQNPNGCGVRVCRTPMLWDGGGCRTPNPMAVGWGCAGPQCYGMEAMLTALSPPNPPLPSGPGLGALRGAL